MTTQTSPQNVSLSRLFIALLLALLSLSVACSEEQNSESAGDYSGAYAPPAPVSTEGGPSDSDYIDDVGTAGGAESLADVSAAPSQGSGAQARTLTAGLWDDNAYPEHYKRYAESGAHPELSDLPVERQLVRVVNAEGEPVRDAEVTIAGLTLKTSSHGYALYTLEELGEGEQVEVSARLGAKSASATFERAQGDATWNLTLESAPSASAQKLDLALIIDATGSMGDEIDFLKVELDDIITQLQTLYPNLDIRLAITSYRDELDAYVTRSLDFTSDLSEAKLALNAVNAGGGGDFPEAMGEAMEESVGLSWREEEGVARVAFLVADAPPQTNRQARVDRAARVARSKGIRLFPIASSGVDGGAEWAMRQMAAFSLGHYLFLTDDSGVGGAHAEPHIPCYEVRLLQTLIFRVIQSDIEGVWLDGDDDEVIRSVGFNANGECVGAADVQAQGGAEGGAEMSAGAEGGAEMSAGAEGGAEMSAGAEGGAEMSAGAEGGAEMSAGAEGGAEMSAGAEGGAEMSGGAEGGAEMSAGAEG